MKKAIAVLALAASSLSTPWASASALPKTYQPFRLVHQFGSYGNTDGRDGDCAVAAIGDLIQLQQAMDGKPSGLHGQASGLLKTPPLLTLYHALSPTNDGANPDVLLNLWQTTGIEGYFIKGWDQQTIDQANIESGIVEDQGLYAEVELPLGGMFGVDVPQMNNNAPSYFPSIPWTPENTGPLSEGWAAHQVALVGYGPTYLYLATWGGVQAVTWAWWSEYGVAVWGVTPG